MRLKSDVGRVANLRPIANRPPDGALHASDILNNIIGLTLESRPAKLTLGGNDRSLTVTARKGLPSRDRKGAVMVGAVTFIPTPVRLALLITVPPAPHRGPN